MREARSIGRRVALLILAAWLAAPAAAAEPAAFQPPAGLARGWYASIETTMGTVLVRLLPEQAPQSVAHFAGLAQGTLGWLDPLSGETVKVPYYDGMLIHTVYAGRLFETGDAGAMGRAMPMLFVPEDEGHGPVNFNSPYVLGMTRVGAGRISGAKFFVTVASQPWLNGSSPCFGEVVDGRETVFNISQVKAYSNRRPIRDVRIETIRIFPVGDPPPLPAPEPYQPRRKEVEQRPDRAPVPR